MKRLLVWPCMILLAASALAEGPDDHFIRVYRVIQEADGLRESGEGARALARYAEAEQGLNRLKALYPTWNEKIIRFRLGYIAEKTAAIRATLPATASVPQPAPEKPAVVVPASVEAELAALKEQVRQLEGDKAVLGARLKEALSAQPAAVDPKSLERAEARVRALEKETDLLRSAVDKTKESATSTAKAEAASAAESRKLLEEARVRLAAQERAINDLKRAGSSAPERAELAKAQERVRLMAAENELLKRRVGELEKAPSASPSKELEKLREELGEVKAELARQRQQSERLIEENRRLAKGLETAERLARTSENNRQRLERELADVSARVETSGSDTNQLGMFGRARMRRLARERERLEEDLRAARTAAETDKALVGTLQREKRELENRLKDQTRDAGVARESERIRELERERDALQKELKESAKKSASRRAPAAPPARDTEKEVASLKARLEVLEAKKEPFTQEEMALFRRPESGGSVPAQPAPDAAAAARVASVRKAKDLPAGAAGLVMEAQRAFQARRFDEAERGYREVLRLDDRNVFTLANLAAILLEQNKLGEAETHLTKALQQDPEDPFSLSMLGRVQFQQEKYDAAVETLSLAARVDPQNAETQNYLGITLSQKGLRVPAEAALRKAIQISPGYASAHHNLAIIYATQTPPFVELARWHYQKALAGGHAKNPELEGLFEGKKSAAVAK